MHFSDVILCAFSVIWWNLSLLGFRNGMTQKYLPFWTLKALQRLWWCSFGCKLVWNGFLEVDNRIFVNESIKIGWHHCQSWFLRENLFPVTEKLFRLTKNHFLSLFKSWHALDCFRNDLFHLNAYKRNKNSNNHRNKFS